MRTRLLLFVLLCTGYCTQVVSQTNPNPGNTFPTIVPPSPELSSLANIGTLTAQNQTGAANVNIPLYDLKVGSIDVPLSIQYSTNGIKVNDVPGRVGLGWNLLAGGSISRIIHDEDDDATSTLHLPDPSPGSTSFETWLHEATGPFYGDTEKDEYSYNVNGMSGKFYVDDNGLAHCETQSEIEIVKNAYGFILTTGLGIKYYFGGSNLEETKDLKINGTHKLPPVSTTGWFLYRIASLEGEIVDFHYTAINVKYYLGPSQMAMLSPKLPEYEWLPEFNCKTCDNDKGIIYPVTQNWIEYDTHFLTEITCSNGLNVTLGYESRNDLSRDNRLVSMQISIDNVNGAGTLIKRYGFTYDDYPIEDDNQTRFYLRELLSYPGDEGPALIHSFEYDDPGTLPSEKSTGGQDYFGYSKSTVPPGPNSTGNTGNFFPRIPEYDSYYNADLGTDRSPNFEGAKKGTLKKVIYPTGGYREFVYEPHTVMKQKFDATYSYVNLIQSGAGYTDTLSVIRDFFTEVPGGEDITIDYQTMSNPDWFIANPQPQFWEAGDGKKISYLYILDAYYNIIESYNHDYYPAANSITFHIDYNKHYKIRLTVRSLSYRAKVLFRYNPRTIASYINVEGCGARVKQINSFDPVTNKTTSKYFTYASLISAATGLGKQVTGDDDPATPANIQPLTILSSGVGATVSSYKSSYTHGGFCLKWAGTPSGDPNSSIWMVELCHNFIQVSSSSISGSQTFSGSPIAYPYIIESDDPNFIHGGTEHFYSTHYNPNTVTPVLNTPVQANLGFGEDLNGRELKTRVFKATSDKFIVLSQEESIYGGDTRTLSYANNYPTRKRFDKLDISLTPSIMSTEDRISMYDVGGYTLTSTWHHLDSKITTTYDENGMNPMLQQVVYEYADIYHKQPTAITTTNSKGETVRQESKYPNDFNSPPVYPEMVSAHVITPVIEQTNIVAGNTISKANTDYEKWEPTNFFKPSKVWVTKGNLPAELNLEYNKYDLFANPLELSGQSGMKIMYLWNYNHSFPVAEVKYDILTKIAYTSFEADDNGNWDIQTPGGMQNEGITGKKSFSGVISCKDLNESQKYTVTLWAKGEVAVNNTAGTLIKTKGLWSLYRWEITGVDIIDVDGNYMDEVRLIPSGASITTYTYNAGIGLSSVCDVNNNIIYYEYDGFNRLVLVRDIDKNIIKQYEYKYGQTISPCENTEANWVATGNTRCVGTEPSNNYWTHDREREFRDESNCSPTYLDTRWEVFEHNVCTPVSNCNTPDCRVVNGVAQQGVKTLLSTTCNEYGCICTFVYVWSDGHQGPPFTEANTPGCTNPTPPETND